MFGVIALFVIILLVGIIAFFANRYLEDLDEGIKGVSRWLR